MKRLLFSLSKITVFIALVCIVTSPIPTASAKTVTLRFANYFNADSEIGRLYSDYCKEVKKRSNGQVDITYFPGGSLVNSKDSPDAVSNGIVDMAYCCPSHNPGRFPATDIFGTMMGFPTAYVASHVADDYIKHIINEKEFSGYKILLSGSFSPMVFFSNVPVTTIDNFKGLKIRARSTAADTVKAWGAIPVSMPISDCYDALTKGVIDGMTVGLEAGKNWRIGEATKYCTLTWKIFMPPIFFVMMNENSYNRLPAEAKKVLEDVSADYVEKLALANNEMDIVSAKFCKDKKMKFINLSDEEAMKGQAVTKAILDNYVVSLNAKGNKEAKNYVEYISSRTEYWYQQQVKNGVKSPMGPKEVLIPGLIEN